MKFVIFRTPAEQARGLRGMKPIPAETAFIFPGVKPGQRITAAGVLESFDVTFLNSDYGFIGTWQLDPGAETVEAPAGAALAIETRPLTPIEKPDLERLRRLLGRKA